MIILAEKTKLIKKVLLTFEREFDIITVIKIIWWLPKQ